MKRKALLPLLLAGVCTAASAQYTYDIKGVAPEGDKMVYINKTRTEIDSFAVTDGKFTAEGKSTQPTAYVITKSQRTPVIMVDAPIRMDLVNYTSEGSDINTKLMGYHKELAAYEKEMNDIRMDYMTKKLSGAAEGSPELKQLVDRYDAIEAKKMERIVQISRENTDNLIPAVYLSQVIMMLPDSVAEPLLNKSYAYMQTERMQKYAADFAKKQLTASGKPFSDFAMTGLDGSAVKLSDYVGKGKYVLVDFWASWCGPCRADMPHVVKLYNTYKTKNFEIVGVSFDSKDEAWRDAVKQMGIEWPQMSDLKGWKSVGSDVYGIRAIPATVLIAPDGTIIARDLRGETLDAKLAELFD